MESAQCRLFSQATPPASSKNMHDLFLQFFLVLKSSRDRGATETEDKAHAKFLGGRHTVLPQSYAQMATYCEEQALSRSKMFQSRRLLKAHKGSFQMKESWKLYKIDKYASLLCTKCSASKLLINVRYTIIIIHGNLPPFWSPPLDMDIGGSVDARCSDFWWELNFVRFHS